VEVIVSPLSIGVIVLYHVLEYSSKAIVHFSTLKLYNLKFFLYFDEKEIAI